VRLGDQALATLQSHYPTIGGVLALAVIAYVGFRWLRKRRAADAG